MTQGARAVAREVLQRVRADKAYVSLALAAQLDGSPLDGRDRALVTEIVYGVMRHRNRLDSAVAAMATRGIKDLAPRMKDILRVAAYQMLFLDRIPPYAAVDDAVEAARSFGGSALAGFANRVLRRLVTEGEPPGPDRDGDPLTHAEWACSLPRWLAKRLQGALGSEFLAAAEEFVRPPPLALRVNRLRHSAQDAIERLGRDHPGATIDRTHLAGHALLVRGLGDPRASSSFRQGVWTIQDLAAQLVSVYADPRPGQRILDACAGQGGKATHLAELTGDRASIDAVDIAAAKLERTGQAASRLGINSIRRIAADLLEPNAPLELSYDLVLLDAPCSGLGVLRRHPELKWRLGEDEIGRFAALQARLLDAAARRVRGGGALVYSVCTFTDEEGPTQVGEFLARNGGFFLGLPGPVCSDVLDEEGLLRTWPHRHQSDAFFAARLVKRA